MLATAQNLVLISADDLQNIVTTAVAEQLQKHFPQLNDPFNEYPNLLTRNEVCTMLQVSKATLNNWTNDGRLRPQKQGRVIRFQKSEVLNLFRTAPKHKRV